MFFSLLQSAWQGFCRTVVAVFYRRVEVEGLDHFPKSGPVLICANHANALADAVILQAVIPRLLHPVARSGLFKNWLLKPFLLTMQAVPIYRRQDKATSTSSNRSANMDAFQRCYEMFELGEVILIFPEGQSHSDSSLHQIKSGAARMIVGSIKKEIPLTVLPVGLTFSNKGKFRSNVFIKIGEPVQVVAGADADGQVVRQLTSDIRRAIESVTINVDEADDLDFLKRVERFFAMRHGKYRHRNMALRFQALQKINHAYLKLREHAPERLSQLKHKLHQYERLCHIWKINAYQISIQYTPSLITRFIVRSLTIIFVLLPVGLWGIINSYIPFLLTRHIARFSSKDTDQYDTAKMVLGLSLFPLFWGGQIWWLSSHVTMLPLIIYIVSLPISAAAALFLRREQHRIRVNLRVFFLFVRKRKLKKYMENRRKELERELARLVRIAKQIKVSKQDEKN